MEKIKILHSGDYHLGEDHLQFPKRRQEIMSSFLKMVDFCKQKQVDILLLAGDFLESVSVRHDELQTIIHAFHSLDSKIFISPGNHDFYAIDSPYFKLTWPENVTIFKPRMERRDLPSLGISIFGAGFSSTYQKTPLMDQFKNIKVDPKNINIMLMHGDLVSEGSSSKYNPISKEAILASQMDYFALGHIHIRSLENVGKTTYAYCGSPDGSSFAELGERGAYYLEITKEKKEITFVSFESRKYLRHTIKLDQEKSQKDLLDTIKEKLLEDDDYQKNYYQIRLKGFRPKSLTIYPSYLEDSLLDFVSYLEIKDLTVPFYDLDNLLHQQNLVGYFVASILEEEKKAKEKGDKKQVKRLKQALLYGLAAFDGKEQILDPS